MKENQSLQKPPLGNTNNLEKPSTQKSTVSPASRANERTLEEDTHSRLPINSSASTNKTMPSTPQHNLVHSTLPQNQCAQHSAGQYASTPTIEQTPNTKHPLRAWTEILHTGTRAPKCHHRRSIPSQSTRALKSHPNNGNRP